MLLSTCPTLTPDTNIVTNGSMPTNTAIIAVTILMVTITMEITPVTMAMVKITMTIVKWGVTVVS